MELEVREKSNQGDSVCHIEDEAAIIAAAKNGQTGSFELLIQRYERKILLQAMRITRNWQDAEDVRQQSVLKAFTRLHSFQGNSSFSTWLFRIAVNEALMLLRRKRSWHEVQVEDSDEMDVEMSIPHTLRYSVAADDHCLAQERKQILYAALKRLTPAMRVVIQLRDLEECSMREIARILGISVRAAKTRVFHGRRRLREVLNRDPRARSVWGRPARQQKRSIQQPRFAHQPHKSNRGERPEFPSCPSLYELSVRVHAETPQISMG